MKQLHPILGAVFGSQELELPEGLTADSWKDRLNDLDVLVAAEADAHREGKDAREIVEKFKEKHQEPALLRAGPQRGLDKIAVRMEAYSNDMDERHKAVASRVGVTAPIAPKELRDLFDSEGRTFSSELGLTKIKMEMEVISDLARRARDDKAAQAELAAIAHRAFDKDNPDLIAATALTHLSPSIQRRVREFGMVDVGRMLTEWRMERHPDEFKALRAIEVLAARAFSDANAAASAIEKLAAPGRLDRSKLDAALKPIERFASVGSSK